MQAVKGRDTVPEDRVAAALATLKVRFRRYSTNLPGTPDFVLPEARAVLLVHGCFWHQHGCRTRMPRTNNAYWMAKLARNVARDQRVRRQLNRLGWSVIAVWECRVVTPQRAVTAVAGAVRFAKGSRARAQRLGRTGA